MVAFADLESVRVELVEKHAAKQSPSRIEELVQIFVQATRVGFLCLKDGVQRLIQFLDGDWVLGHGFESVNMVGYAKIEKTSLWNRAGSYRWQTASLLDLPNSIQTSNSYCAVSR